MLKIFPLLLIPALALPGPAFSGQKRVSKDTRWLCYYGGDRRVLEVPGLDLLILESEAIGDLSPEDRKGRLCVAYMSIGEAEANRWYWPDIKDKPWVLDPNPDWPDSRRVDVRSGEWQDLLVEMIAPTMIEAGYDGFILDNVDNGEILLEMDADLFKGADDATVSLIERLRRTFPEAVIIANNGLGIVPRVADQVDAMMYEGTVHTWKARPDGSYSYGEVSPKIRNWLRPRLLRIKNAGVPILALEYLEPGDDETYRKVWEAVVKAGNSPYLSVRDLDVFPGSDKLPPLPEEEEE
ncbi:MAG: endo alpha-1,4 polygalactosaminidase [Planctomycetota bacterium]|jgi:uncharacterized protein (TIGR01370 family)|nr:endo alpha-1,4 polygalactosaminidase [Planctomycetota bacterium]